MKVSKKFLLSATLFAVAISFSFYITKSEKSPLSRHVSASGKHRKIVHLSSINLMAPNATQLHKQTTANPGTAHSTNTCDGTGSDCSKDCVANLDWFSAVASRNAGTIRSYAHDNYTRLSDDTPEDVLDGVIAGNINVTMNSSTDGTASVVNIVFATGTGIVFVSQYPM